MFRSYLTSALRSLFRNKVPSVINIVGLSIALAASIVVYLFLQVYYTLDAFHEHGERIFIAEQVVARGSEEQTWGTVPLALGPALSADLPQVERTVRMAWAGGDVRTAETTFEERIGFAERDFFDVFTFPLQLGTKDALSDPGNVILSQAGAIKYFGDEDPLGRRLTISFGESGAQTYTVAGVASPFPNNTGFRFDILLSFDARPASANDEWSTNVDATFLLLRRSDDIHAVASQMERYVARANAANPEARIERFVFENLMHPAPNAYEVIQRPTEAPHPAFSIILVALALFMMALSCFNYVNIALGSAARRIKEIGVRKVIGGTKRQLVVQFMTENLLICALAMVLGIGLAWLFLIPLFNGLFVLQIGLSLMDNLGLWAFLIGLLAFVGCASGAYPALYIASFQPVLIFREKQRPADRRWFTRSLMTAQFVIAFLAVIATVVLLMNGRYLRGQEWGYESDGVLVVRLSDPNQFDIMRAAAAEQASVLSTAGSQGHVGVAMGRTRFTLGDEQEHEVVEIAVGPGYLETMGLRLHSGRLFDERLHGGDGVIINRRLAEEQGWVEPLGREFRIAHTNVTVVGVVEDFLFDAVTRPQPVIFRRSDDAYNFLTMRVAPGTEAATQARLEAQWNVVAPEVPFNAFTQAEVFDAQFESYENLSRGIAYLAALALLIACMGVYGLSAQNVARRMKEVSVRKVLGASIPHLILLVNRIFVVILAAAAVFASAIGYAGILTLISADIANFMPLTPAPFLIAYLVVLLTVALSVASQSRTLANANPADILRGN